MTTFSMELSMKIQTVAIQVLHDVLVRLEVQLVALFRVIIHAQKLF
jgi:hypothetical protein